MSHYRDEKNKAILDTLSNSRDRMDSMETHKQMVNMDTLCRLKKPTLLVTWFILRPPFMCLKQDRRNWDPRTWNTRSNTLECLSLWLVPLTVVINCMSLSNHYGESYLDQQIWSLPTVFTSILVSFLGLLLRRFHCVFFDQSRSCPELRGTSCSDKHWTLSSAHTNLRILRLVLHYASCLWISALHWWQDPRLEIFVDYFLSRSYKDILIVIGTHWVCGHMWKFALWW